MNARTAMLAAAAMAAALYPAASPAQGALENPSSASIESGIGAITGWHCTSRRIELRIDGESLGLAGAGTSRMDTAATCGRADTGFSFLFNYALLRGGSHRLDAYADGQLFASATFTAGYLGGEFLTGLSAAHQVPYFPGPAQKARVAWSQSKQGFVVSGVEPLLGGSLVGDYAIRQMTVATSAGMMASTLQGDIRISGSMSFRANGTYTTRMTLEGTGMPPETVSANGTYSDRGHYMLQDGAGLAILERGETLTFMGMAPSGADWGSVVLSLTRSGAEPSSFEKLETEPLPGGALAAMAAAAQRMLKAP